MILKAETLKIKGSHSVRTFLQHHNIAEGITRLRSTQAQLSLLPLLTPLTTAHDPSVINSSNPNNFPTTPILNIINIGN